MSAEVVSTPLSGPRVPVRIVDPTHWEIRALPWIRRTCASLGTTSHDLQAGPAVIRVITDDPHIRSCLREGFPEAAPDGRPAMVAYVLAWIRDASDLKRILGIEKEEDLAAEAARAAEEAADPYFRMGLDETRADAARREEDAIRRPIALFSPPGRVFLLLNDNDYGEVRSRAVLGALEAHLASSVRIDAQRRVVDPESSRILLHGAAATIHPDRGIVLIGPDGAGKRTCAAGLARWKEGGRFVPEGSFIVRLSDRAIQIPERRFLVRADLDRVVPGLADRLAPVRAENSGRRARALIDPSALPGGGIPDGTVLTHLLIVRRDYDDSSVVREISFKEAMGVLTGPGNAPVFDTDRRDADGYPVRIGSRTDPYFNPCALHAEIDAAGGHYGETDRKRIASLLHLAREGGVRLILLNPRLPPQQTQLCLRKHLSGEGESVEALKGKEVPDDPIWALGLKKRTKDVDPARREIERVGFFHGEEDEVEVVAFKAGGAISELVAFRKGREDRDSIVACSRSDVPYFFKTGAHLGLDDLFPPTDV